jgi:hypothetical protein
LSAFNFDAAVNEKGEMGASLEKLNVTFGDYKVSQTFSKDSVYYNNDKKFLQDNNVGTTRSELVQFAKSVSSYSASPDNVFSADAELIVAAGMMPEAPFGLYIQAVEILTTRSEVLKSGQLLKTANVDSTTISANIDSLDLNTLEELYKDIKSIHADADSLKSANVSPETLAKIASIRTDMNNVMSQVYEALRAQQSAGSINPAVEAKGGADKLAIEERYASGQVGDPAAIAELTFDNPENTLQTSLVEQASDTDAEAAAATEVTTPVSALVDMGIYSNPSLLSQFKADGTFGTSGLIGSEALAVAS